MHNSLAFFKKCWVLVLNFYAILIRLFKSCLLIWESAEICVENSLIHSEILCRYFVSIHVKHNNLTWFNEVIVKIGLLYGRKNLRVGYGLKHVVEVKKTDVF